MDFDLTAEQRLLKDSMDRLLSDRYGMDQRRAHRAEPEGWSRAAWSGFADLGLLGLPFDEADGGFGGGPVDLAATMEAFGRALVIEPYVATIVAAGSVLRRAGSPAQRAALVPGIADGSRILALAEFERRSRGDIGHIETRATHADGWRISGEKSLVLYGDSADVLLVTARTPGGLGVFVVDAGAPGVTRRGYPTQDGMRAAEIAFADSPGEPLGDPDGARPALDHARDETIAALCAEAVGTMQAMHDLTVDYLKTRTQFGRPIGDNQALQHRAVDMYVALEQARSMAMYAAMMVDAPAPERTRAMHAAKVQIGRSGRHIGQEAVQLHGGIGVTMEYAVGHHFKRMTMIERGLGDTNYHLAALARAGGLIAA